MSIFRRKNVIAFTALLLSITLIIPAYADVTNDDISDAVAAKEQGEQELISTEERINELEKLKGDSETYLNELSIQLGELQGQLEEIRILCAERKTELESIKSELAAQNVLEQEQYEEMKLRIQYMYEETSNSGLLESLFSAESFSDFLNRAETMSEINRYDRDMLNSYSETIKGIEKKEQEIIKEQQKLAALEEDLNAQIVQIQQIYEATYNDLRAYADQISENESYESAIVAEIRRQEESIDYMLAQAYAEEAARRAEQEASAVAAALASTYEAAAEEAAIPEEPGEQQASPEVPDEDGGETAAPAEAANEPEEPADAPSDAGESEEAEAPAEEPEAPAEEPQAEPEPSTEGATYLGNFTLTAYCGCAQCCGQWASANPTTASGAPCVEGVTVAMGGVPFGTQLLIDGHVYTVQDRGTAYGHVDIYFNEHSAALAFGMRSADVYQLG